MKRSEALELANEALDYLWKRSTDDSSLLSNAMNIISEMIVEEANKEKTA